MSKTWRISMPSTGAVARSAPQEEQHSGSWSMTEVGSSRFFSVAPGAPGCLPRLRVRSSLRAALAAARLAARSLAASALSLIESAEGGSDEFFELRPTRCSSSVILAFSSSISRSWAATRARSSSFAATRSDRLSDTPEIRARRRQLRESPGQHPIWTTPV